MIHEDWLEMQHWMYEGHDRLRRQGDHWLHWLEINFTKITSSHLMIESKIFQNICNWAPYPIMCDTHLDYEITLIN